MPTTTTTLPVFYVYVLYRDAEFTLPFYVGKGKGRRVRDHTLPGNLRRGDAKALIVRSLLDTIGFVPHRFVERDLTEEAALALEKALIKTFGIIPNGPLANVAESGSVSRGHTGHRHSPETKERLRKLATGKKQSVETIAKRVAGTRAKLKGRRIGPQSVEVKAKRAVAMAAFWATAEGRSTMSAAGMRGKHHRPESKAAISKSNRERAPTAADLQRYRRAGEGLVEWSKQAPNAPTRMKGRRFITNGLEDSTIVAGESPPEGWRFGRIYRPPITEAHRKAARRVGLASKGRTISVEGRGNMRVAALRRAPPSDITRKRLSDAAKRQWSKEKE